PARTAERDGSAAAWRRGQLRRRGAAESRSDVAEARRQLQAGERPAAFECVQRCHGGPRQGDSLRREERLELEPGETGSKEVAADVRDPVLPWVEVEDEFPLGVAGDVTEEGGAVARVVDRAEDRRRL